MMGGILHFYDYIHHRFELLSGDAIEINILSINELYSVEIRMTYIMS